MRVEKLLLLLTVCLAVYDYRMKRVPNWVTLPLLLVGALLHFPGASETWLSCLLLFTAWRCRALAGGDAKLWMALLWLVPLDLAQPAALMMAGAFLVTSLVQLLWRKLHDRPVFGVCSPGAWRAVPFALWMVAVGS
jgi:Flp pilus assembly protein protease CpaA